MANETRKYLLDKFQSHLQDEFNSFCSRHDTGQTNQNLITFLIDQDLIPQSTIRKYVVLKEFSKVYAASEGNKTAAVGIISHRFNISERTVWNILKHLKN